MSNIQIKARLYNKAVGTVLYWLGATQAFAILYWYVAVLLQIFYIILGRRLEKISAVKVLANEQKGVYGFRLWEFKDASQKDTVILNDDRLNAQL